MVDSNVIGLFPLAINGAQYVVSFLDDDTKESEVNFFKRKSEVLLAFRNYLARNKRVDCQNHRFQTDGGGEYNSNE